MIASELSQHHKYKLLKEKKTNPGKTPTPIATVNQQPP
jgi:hypothetical protein